MTKKDKKAAAAQAREEKVKLQRILAANVPNLCYHI